MIYVLDKFDKLVTVLNTDDTISEGIVVLSAGSKEINGGSNTIEVTVDSSHVDCGLISDSENQSLLFKNSEGNWEQFFIFDIEDNHESTMTKTLLGESISQELENRFVITDIPVLDGTPQALISFCLAPSRWLLGECDLTGNKIHMLDTKNRSVSELLVDCSKLFECDFRFRIVVDPSQPSKILDRVVDFKKKMTTDKGKIFAFDKDIVSVKKTVDSSNVKSAIIPVMTSEGEEGSEVASIKDVVWSVASGHPTDKPKGQEWVGNDNTLQLWGYYNKVEKTMNHRFMKAEFSEATSGEQLLAQAWNVLNMNSVPKITYEMKVVDLFRQTKDPDLKHENVVIGEKVRVVDKEFNPPMIVEAHIVEIERDLLNPENDVIVVGNPRNTLADSFSNIQGQLDDKLSIKDLGQQIIQLKENTYYVENTRPIPIEQSNKDILFVNMVLSGTTEVMLHFTGCVEATTNSLLTITVSNNGIEFPFKPRQTLVKGFNLITFNLPMFGLESMIENKLFVSMKVDVGSLEIKTKQCNMVIKGSKILISDKVPPFNRGEHYEKIEVPTFQTAALKPSYSVGIMKKNPTFHNPRHSESIIVPKMDVTIILK